MIARPVCWIYVSLLSSVLAGAVVGCSKAPSFWVTRQEQHEVAVETATVVHVSTHNGAVTADGVEDHDGKVIVDVQVNGGGPTQADAQAALDAIAVIAQREADQVRIAWEWSAPKQDSWHARVAFEVHLPATMALTAESHNGGLVARTIAGECVLETHNGQIIAADLAGRCNLSTHNGEIQARTTGPAVEATSHNGALKVVTTAADLLLETHNGKISVWLNAEGEVGGRVTTSNGGVSITLGDTASTMLDCSTSHGRIHCSHNLEKASVKKTTLKGAVRGGTKVLNVQTSNGGVTIR
ncbi:MAG: DUF4097 domain-containing protein [bacterium]|nr:DUF4097 domain-containing protein [bacterium]